MAIGKADKNLTLGIWFTGDMSQALKTMDKKIGKALNKAQTSLNRFAAGMNKVNSATKKLSKTQNDLTKQLGRVSGAWNRVKSAMKVTVSYGLAASAIYAVTAALREGVKEIMDYDQALKNLQAITIATDAEILNMGDVMRELARETKFSAREVGEGMVLLGQAGFSAAEVMSSIKAATTLATGTLSAMSMTTDLLTTTLRAFVIDASESGRVVDVMASAINRSKLTVEKLRTAFNYVGAAAAQTGLSLEQTAATMMVLANNGLRASTIGTGMRQVLARLLAPSAKLREAFERHGIALEKVNPRLVGYETSLKNLAPLIWDNQKKVVNMTKAYELFGLRGAQAAAVIIKAIKSGEWEDMIDKVYDVGAAYRMAAIQQEGLAVKFKNLLDRLGNIALALGDAGITEILRTVIDALRALASGVENFIRTWGKLTANMIKFSVIVFGTIKIIGSLQGSMLALILVSRGMTTGFAALTLQATLLGRALLAVKAALLTTLAFFSTFTGVLTAIALVVGGLYYAWTRYTTATKENEAELRKQARSHSELFNKLGGVHQRLIDLKDTTKGVITESREYQAILERLILDHPELERTINDVKESYEDTIEVVKELQVIQARARWADITRDINEFAKNLEAVNQQGYNVWEGFQKALDDTSFFKRLPKDTQEAVVHINRFMDILVKEMAEMINLGKETEHSARLRLDTIFGFLRASGIAQERLDKLLKKIRKDEETVNKIRSQVSSEAWSAAERKYWSMIASYREDAVLKEEAAHEKRVLDIKSFYDKIIKEVKENEGLLAEAKALRISLEEEEEEHHQAVLLKIQMKKDELILKLLHAQERAKMAVKSREAGEDSKLLTDITANRLQNDKELYEGLLALSDTYIAGLKLIYTEGHEILQVAELARANLIAGSEEKVTKSTEKHKKETIKSDQIYWRRKLRDTDQKSKEWVYILEKSYEANVISYDEYLDKMTAATGNWLENFKHGIERSNEDIKSWGQLWQDIGTDVNEQIASGITDELFNVVDGTKSAEEAFQDYARSILKWISEIIIKWAILKALGFMSSVAGTGGGGGGGGGGATPMTTTIPLQHSGGIVGLSPAPVRITNPNAFLNAPKLHSGGLASNEVPTILKKGEGVFTEEQMAAMGSNDISIVNIMDPSMLDSYMASAKGKNAVLNVIGRSKGTIKRIMR